MAKISQIKYLQWRPIGVCDSGSDKDRKARMFSKSDFARVTVPEINRGNWRQNRELIQLIERYAAEVAKISTLTDGMVSPEISEIKLVGAVIRLDQTPILNQESSEGKVQFFQVCFRDGKPKKKSYIRWKKWLKFLMISSVSVFALVMIYLALIKLFGLPEGDTKKIVSCNYSRKNKAYTEEIQSIRESLLFDLSLLPEWSTFKEARAQCDSGKLKLIKQEKRLLKCYLTVRTRVNDLPLIARPNLDKIETCVQMLCSRRLSHLSSLCKRL